MKTQVRSESAGLTVIFDGDLKQEHKQRIAEAISIMTGVHMVTDDDMPQDSDVYFAKSQARLELGTQIWEVLYPKKGKS